MAKNKPDLKASKRFQNKKNAKKFAFFSGGELIDLTKHKNAKSRYKVTYNKKQLKKAYKKSNYPGSSLNIEEWYYK